MRFSAGKYCRGGLLLVGHTIIFRIDKHYL